MVYVQLNFRNKSGVTRYTVYHTKGIQKVRSFWGKMTSQTKKLNAPRTCSKISLQYWSRVHVCVLGTI